MKSLLLPVLLLAACAHRPGVPLRVAHGMTTVRDADFGATPAYPADIATSTVADMVLFARNPLGHISATRVIHTLVLRVDYLDRGAWDAMLAPVRARVAARETEAH